MIYILIMVATMHINGKPAATSLSAEFNTIGACQAAAASIRKQFANQTEPEVIVLTCAAKGGAA